MSSTSSSLNELEKDFLLTKVNFWIVFKTNDDLGPDYSDEEKIIILFFNIKIKSKSFN